MSDIHFYEPAKGHRLKHDPFKAIVAPRPIGWISTVSKDGAVNLAPYSYFNAFTSNPPIVGFSSEKKSDSLANAEATGEFVFNLVSLALAQRMSATSYAWPLGVDEMAKAGIAPAPCRLVRPPRVAASPASFECRVVQIVDLRDIEGRTIAARLVLGQVIGVHIGSAFLKDGVFDTEAAQPLARCGSWGDYAVVRELIRMPRPRDEAEATLA
jgi:flavin reductase (DIM6/NTAB) family NADH-FMN oxidoreductase RutF